MVTSETAPVYVVVAVVQMPRGDLASAYLTVEVQSRVLLEYLYTILSVHPIEVIPDAAPGAKKLGQLGKGHWHFLMSWWKLQID